MPTMLRHFVARLRAGQRAPEAGERLGGDVPHLASGGAGRRRATPNDLRRRAEAEADQHPLRFGVCSAGRRRASRAARRAGPSGCTGVAARQPFDRRAGAAVRVDRPLGRFAGRRAAVDGDDPVARAQHALRPARRVSIAAHRGRRTQRRATDGSRLPSARRSVAGCRERAPPRTARRRSAMFTRRPREDHDDPLPRRLVVVGAPRRLGVEVAELLGVHARDLHVAARRDRADRVLRLAAADLEAASAGRTARSAPRACPRPSRR